MKTDKLRHKSLPSDPTDKVRKADHINLAFESAVNSNEIDHRFYYEPMLHAHPKKMEDLSISFLGKKMNWPIWISSMTGGTDHAQKINQNLASVCGEFGFGMGLGSCRMLLESDERLEDFSVRHLMGDHLPLYANLGIAQIENIVASDNYQLIENLLIKLQADGLIIHVNPLQEWLQPEGDAINQPPLKTIESLITNLPGKYIVKEVGQGMGPESLLALLKLPLEAVEFAAHGGTNFSKLELLRGANDQMEAYEKLGHIGHSAEEMVHFANQILLKFDDQIKCQQLIISGGVKDFLDGYYLTSKSNFTSVYGQASGFLKYAKDNYELLKKHVELQLEGLQLANRYLKVK